MLTMEEAELPTKENVGVPIGIVWDPHQLTNYGPHGLDKDSALAPQETPLIAMTIYPIEQTKSMKPLDTEQKMVLNYMKTDGGSKERIHHQVPHGMLLESVKPHTHQIKLIALLHQFGTAPQLIGDLLKLEKEVDCSEPDGGL
jgi:hypothetical protein